MTRRILVTSALPYANGPIHLGHLVEYIQTDIWVRFQKLRGHSCIYVCADDAHGTPIMLKARELGVTPEALIQRIGEEHRRDFAGFLIDFDNYYTTHSDENRFYAELIYKRLDAAGHISRRTIAQAYDPVEQLFLPDRYIRGGCPRCGADDQYGDSCEVCGATYAPTELSNARSVISGAAPVSRESEHYFFRLNDFKDLLKDWAGTGHLQPEVANKLAEWFGEGLREWDISRDAPYFGFRIPGTDNKYFYVWLDAPIGYMASFRHWCERTGMRFDDYWSPDSDTELYHFIGKDIVYFHALFWPAMLHGAGFRMPTQVFAHGFLTVNGQKMSKSRGTFIMASSWLDHLDPEHLRYYLAAKLGGSVHDLDLNLDDFVQRVNADLVGKIVNLASRSASFINKRFAGQLSDSLVSPDLHARFVAAGDSLAEAYEQREYARAMREIMTLADEANRYFDDCKPWVLARDESSLAQVQAVCTLTLNLFRVLMLYLKPVLPEIVAAAERFLRCEPLTWANREIPLLDQRIDPFTPLAQRVDPAAVAALIEASRGTLKETTQQAPATPATSPAITIDAFASIDLRVARIVSASAVDGSDKLLRLELDLGELGARTVFAGLAQHLVPDTLEGRLTVVVANLEPRRMRFGVSEGMVLAASGDGTGPCLLSVDSPAQPGMRIR